MPFFEEEQITQSRPIPGVSQTPEDSPGFMDYVTDAPLGIGRGIISFGESLAELADSGAELIGSDIFEGNDLTWSEDLLGENKTWVGTLTSGVTQFAAGFVPVAGVLGKAGKAGKALKALKNSDRLRDSLAYGAIVGAPTDFIAFNGHEGRLADLIQQYPGLQNPITDALSSDPDDSEWEGRFKNAAEGLLVGPAAELLLHGVRFLKGAKNAEAKGGVKGRDDWVAKNQEKYAEELSKIENPLTMLEAKEQLTSLGYKPEEIDAWSAIVGATARRFDTDEDTLLGISTRELRSDANAPNLKDEANRLIDEAIGEGGKTASDLVDYLIKASKNDPALKSGSDLDRLLADAMDYSLYQSDGSIDSVIDYVKQKTSNVDLRSDANALTSAFQSGDITTLISDTADIFRRHMEQFDEKLSNTAKEVFKVGKEGWTEAKSKKFSDAFVSYLHKGSTPDKGMTKVFDNFKAWIGEVYNKLGGSRYSDKIDPQVRDFFDQMLGGRTAAQRNLDVPVKVREAITERLGAVTRGEVELEDALEGIDFNFDKLVADVEAKELLNIVSEEFGKQINALKGGVESLNTTAQKALKELDEDLDAKGGMLDRLRDGKADAKDVVAAKMVMSGLSSKIMSLSDKMEIGSITKIEMVQLQRHLEELIHLGADLKANITEAARITSAGRIPIESMVPANKLDELLIRSGGDQRLRDVAKHIKMTEGDPRSTMRVLRQRWDTRGRRLIGIHNELWLNSILSGPVTHAVNLLSTALHGVVRSAEKVVGGAVQGALGGGFKSTQEGVDELLGLWYGRKGILKFIAQTLKTSEPILDAANTTWENGGRPGKGYINGGGGDSLSSKMFDYLGNTVRLPNRFLNAGDELNKQFFYRSHLFAKGMADARRLGIPAGNKRTEHALDYIDKRIGEGGQALDESALYHAQEGTFTNDLDYGIGRTLQKAVNAHPILRLALPFVRTPTNIMRQLWRHTPGMAAFQRQWMEDFKGIHGPERQALAIGQQAVGSTLIFGAFMAAATGRITGGGPTDPRELALLRQTGWQPYSYVSTDPETGKKKYTSYHRLDPFSSALGLVADFVELGNRVNDEDKNTLTSGLMIAFAKNITNKTYLRGLAQTIDVLTDPERNMEMWKQRHMGSYVPNLLNQTNPDDTLREVRSVMDSIKSRTPGFSPMLDPKRNVFGQPITFEGAWGPDFVSPFYQSTGLNSPARDELASLGLAMGQPREKQQGIDLTTLRVAPDQTAYDRWLELVGEVKLQGKGIEEALNDLVQSENYQRLPAQSTMPSGVDSARVKLVKRTIERYRNRARNQMFQENPDIKQLYQNAVVNNRRISVLGAAAGEQQ